MTTLPYLEENILSSVFCKLWILDQFADEAHDDNIITKEEHFICLHIASDNTFYYLIVTIHLLRPLAVNLNCPAERIFYFSILDTSNEVVESLALRATAFLYEGVACNLV